MNLRLKKKQLSRLNKIMYPLVKVLPSEFKRIILNNSLLEILIKGSQSEDPMVISNSWFVSKFEPKNVKEALTDEFWIEAMQEELNQFKRSEMWDLVPRP
jgi:hypothetical protein